MLVAEEGVRTGGWGAELGSQITDAAFGWLTRPVARVGAAETPVPSSKPLEESVLPQPSDIEAAIRDLVAS